MIYCTFFSKDNKTKSIKMKGHANYAEIGKDIVCAGVSSLVQNLAIGLELAIEDVNIMIDGGDFEMKLDDNDIDKVYYLTEAFRISLQLLQDSYPDYVKVIENKEVI